MELTGRAVMVTGASSGIGRETAVLLSGLGARLILVGRREDQLALTLGALEGSDHRVEPFDLTDTDALPGWVKRISREAGPLHGMVHCAGNLIPRALRYLVQSEVDEALRITVGAGLGLARAFRQRGVCGPDGRIVFLSSVMGIIGQPATVAYCASKGAIIAMSKSLALELAGEGIRVNCVAPGYVKTEMADRLREMMTPEQFDAIAAKHPLGVGKPLDVAYAIAYLLGETGRWITGTTLVVDGGYLAQ